MAGAAREGVGSTGSRLLRGQRDAFAAIEARFAAFKGADRSLFFSSGYLANLAVLSALTESGDVLFSDERNHASLIDGARLSRARTVICPHNDPRRLAALLAETACDGARFVIIESLYSMDGDVAPLSAYARVCAAADATLIVDEAHAVGVCGRRGNGLLDDADVDANAVVSINTAGKALGVAGAFVTGPSRVIEYLQQAARPFVFSTAAPPALADALQASLDIVEAEPERRQRVQLLARGLRHGLRDAGVPIDVSPSHIVPVVIGDNDRAVTIARMLQSDGFDVRAIRPPSVPRGTARLRVSINAGLTESTVDRFVDAVTAALRRVEGSGRIAAPAGV
jgi:8-amino-7-oxononanoate synthase